MSSHVADFYAHDKSLTAKLFNSAIGIINFEKLSPNFIAGTTNWFLNSKTLLHQGLSEPKFYGDLVYKFKNFLGRANFSSS